MKKELKGFIIGVTLTLMLISTAVFADSTMKTIQVLFNEVNITVNGKKIEADNIAYQGTTYVPLRAVAESLGKEVGWDQKTKTASINDKREEETVKNSDETVSQKNAIRMAESYLNLTAFSKSGLINQLKYEGFNDKDATYAANQINVDWKEQAVRMAESYLNLTAFSRDGLIKQLEFEGFSNEDATYAASQVGL